MDFRLVAVRLLIKEDRQKGVVLQCIFRSNFAIIGLPLAEALGGVKGSKAVLRNTEDKFYKSKRLAQIQ